MATQDHEHIASIRSYVAVYLVLMALLALTFFLAYLDLRSFNFVLSLLIAVVKTVLVVLYFMHVRHTKPLTKIFVVAGVIWLSILITLSLADYVSRSWIPTTGPWPQKNFRQY